MFVKKGLLCATALALMLFVGQASGQNATLAVDGETTVRGIGANQDIAVTVAVSGVTGQTIGATITFNTGGNATFVDFRPAGGFIKPPGDGITLIGLPPQDLTDGFSFGTATIRTGADVSADTEFSISATVSVNRQGADAVDVSGSLAVNAPLPLGLVADNNAVTVPRGGSAMVTVSSVGFPEGASVNYTFTVAAGITSAASGGTLRITAVTPGSVTVTGSDGTDTTPPLVVTFVSPPPEVIASSKNEVIPTGETATVNIEAVGFAADDQVGFSINQTSGSANITTAIINATTLQLAASGVGGAVVEVSASSGMASTHPVVITFWAMPTVGAAEAMVAVSGSPIGSTTVTATGFPPGATISFNVEMVSGAEGSVTSDDQNGVLTLTASSAAVVSVTASDGTTTTAPVEVAFTQDIPAAPASLTVQDNPADNGFYVLATFSNSEDHGSVNQYRIYREMAENWVPWVVVDAIPSDDNTTRVAVPVPDGIATRWGVAAERGGDTSEVTASGKRVFSKESVQALVELLGLDPNRVVTHEELAEMFMPSADYIKSIIGDRKNVIFAALDPDLSVLVGGDVAVPQNIRTGSGTILTSPLTTTEDAVAAVDNNAPAAVTDVTADAETGMVTWTLSTDDMTVGSIDYRGYGIPIPGVTGYKISGGVSEDAMTDVGVVPAGTSEFQIPLELIQALIDQGVPAALVVVTALDGTNMTASVPLVIELAPTRKAFVDADGGAVYIVKLDDAMTPLTVDLEDFIAFTMAFNASEDTVSREDWRVFIQADLNDDGVVNFDDFILFFSSFGKEAVGRAGKSLIPTLGVNETAELSLRLGSDRVVAGETMFVDVSLANVQALMGYGFVLNYDAEKFEFVEAMPSTEDLLTSAGGETPLFKAVPGEDGQVRVMNAIANGSEVSGGGDIVRLVFRVLRDFEDNARFEIAEGLVFDPSQLANPLAGGVLDIQTTPTEFALLQNFPNPFNPETTIGYELAESADVTLQIYNVVGQVVRTLIAAEPQSVGRYQVRWDGIDDRGTPVSSGIYFYQISAGKFQDVRKLMLLK